MSKNKAKPKGTTMPATERPGNVGRVALFKQLKALQKDYKDILGKAHLWFDCTQRLAAELYVICPGHSIFKGGFFNEKTLEIIKADSKKSIPDCPYSKVVYLEGDKEETVDITELKRSLSKEVMVALPKEVKDD